MADMSSLKRKGGFWRLFALMVMLATVLSMIPVLPASAITPPTITSIANIYGKPYGRAGNTVTIHGTGFVVGDTRVYFTNAAHESTSVTVVNDGTGTELTAVVPSVGSLLGPVDVWVHTPAGNSNYLDDHSVFTYLGSDKLVGIFNTSGGPISSSFEPTVTAYTEGCLLNGTCELAVVLADPVATVDFNGAPPAGVSSGGEFTINYAPIMTLTNHGFRNLDIAVHGPGTTGTTTYTVGIYYPPNGFLPNGGNINTTTPITIDTTGLRSGYQCWYTITPGSAGTPLEGSISSIKYEGSAFTISTPGTYTLMAAATDGVYWNTPIQATFTVTNPSSGGGGGGGGGGTPTPTLQAPNNLKVTDAKGAVSLAWDKNTESNLNGYNIYRKVKGSTAAAAKIATVDKTTSTYKDNAVTAGETYVYYITATNTLPTESSKSNEVEAVVTAAVLAGKVFSDVSADFWAKSFIDRLVGLDIMNGYPDGTFRPGKEVSRSEFAKMICLAMGWTLENPTNPSFSDVASSNWAYKYVETAKAHGAIAGYQDGTFKPNKNITRAEIAKIIASTIHLASGTSSLTDIEDSWAKDSINACVKAGIVAGYNDNTFKPGNTATRAEAAKMICGMLDKK